MCERVDGWTNQMTRDQMLRSAHHQVADEHARGGGAGFRLPGKELAHLRLKTRPQMRGIARAMHHVAREAAVAAPVAGGTLPRAACVGAHDPRRRTQNSDTTQDQQVAHTASSRDSQASSPFIFDQATGLPCKFNVNLEWEYL
jgi:hypothetical protein